MGAIPKKLCQVTPVCAISDPTSAPTLSASGSGGSIQAGAYYVGYTWANDDGETLMSPVGSVTVAAGNTLSITVPTFPEGAVYANIYMASVAGSEKYQYHTMLTTSTFSGPVSTTNASKPSVSSLVPVSCYMVPADITTILRNLILTNTSENEVKVSVNIVPSGGSNEKSNRLVSDYKLLANDTIVIDLGAPISAGDFIQAQQSEAGAINLYISGVEVA